MKKIFTLLSFSFLFLTSSQAQIKKGATFLGGNIGASSGKTTSTNVGNNLNQSQKGVSFSPVFGKAIKENIVVGVNGLYSSRKTDFEGDFNDSKEKTYGFGFFIRKYKQLGKGGFSIFLQGELGGDYYKRDQGSITIIKDEYKQFGIRINVYPGISYSISKRLQLESGLTNLIAIGYNKGKGERTGVQTSSYESESFNVYSSLENLSSFYFGFRLLLNK